jgi:hypothetical protein
VTTPASRLQEYARVVSAPVPAAIAKR